MISTWEKAWDSINDSFAQLALEVLECNADLWWECGHSENEVFPFWAYASFSRFGQAGDEDIVISLSFKRSDGELAFSSDIARGDGEILAAGPTDQASLVADVVSIRDWIAGQVSAGLDFIRNSSELVKRELC